MGSDWKGAHVEITVWMGMDMVYSETVFLDFDTITDLFSRFDPTLYNFDIDPVDDPDDD